jgi:hypothetical protein
VPFEPEVAESGRSKAGPAAPAEALRAEIEARL